MQMSEHARRECVRERVSVFHVLGSVTKLLCTQVPIIGIKSIQ